MVATVTHWSAWAFKPFGVVRPNHVLYHTADLANHLGNLLAEFCHTPLQPRRPACTHSLSLLHPPPPPSTLVVLNTRISAPVPFPHFFPLTTSPFWFRYVCYPAVSLRFSRFSSPTCISLVILFTQCLTVIDLDRAHVPVSTIPLHHVMSYFI